MDDHGLSPLDCRALALQQACPFTIRIVGQRQGSVADEKTLHFLLRQFRVSGEWFRFPEIIVWALANHFGCVIPESIVI